MTETYDTTEQVKRLSSLIADLNLVARELVDHHVVVQVTLTQKETEYKRMYPALKLDGAWLELNPPVIILPR
jgi:hypothetical protein